VNTVVVYFSKFGNTQMVAEEIAEALRLAGAVRVINSAALKAQDFMGADLVVMGTPTHNMSLPKAVRPIFDLLPKRSLKSIPVAAFDTSYKMADRNTPEWLARFTAAPKLARKLRRLGGKQVVAPETFHVKDREGPLYEGELERAARWAQSLVERLKGRSRQRDVQQQAA